MRWFTHCRARRQARGLDTIPRTIARFEAGGDAASAAILRDVIYAQEVEHCAAGLRWFRFCVARDAGAEEAAAEAEVVRRFHACVRRHFHGALKPPFNTDARERAGFVEALYLPLVTHWRDAAAAAAAAAAGGDDEDAA